MMPKPSHSVPRIFVSHSSIDNEFGLKLVNDLRRELGDEDAVWYDVSAGLEGGDAWWPTIVKELTARNVFILVLSPDALKSKWVLDEINIAWLQKNSHVGKRIISVLYRESEVPDDLRILQIVPFLSPATYNNDFNKLLKAIGLDERVIPPTINIFYSYAHEDKRLCREFEKHLALLQWHLQEQGIIAGWHNHMVKPAIEKEKEIDTHLNTDQIILPLISSDFTASEYCRSIEMKQAVERHKRGDAKIIPIILRHVYSQGTPFSNLEVLPTDGRPVNHPLRYQRDKAFSNVIQGIYEAIMDFLSKKHKIENQPLSHSRQPLHPAWIQPPLALRLPGLIQITLIILTILVVIGGAGFISFFVAKGHNTGTVQGTTQVNHTFTAQSPRATTATQTYCPTIASTPTSTTSATLPSPYASYQGKLILDDSMCIPAAHWDVFTDRSPNSPPTCSFTKSAYYVGTEKDAHLCGYSLSPRQGFQNFVYQIRITFVNDQTCGGIAFRQHPSSSVPIVMDYYDFLICTDQTYKLETNNIDYPFSRVLENSGSTTIHQGVGQSNIIAVVAHGTMLDLYINGQKIDSVSDSSFSAGRIGVIAINLSGADTTTKQVAFNDAKLWTL